MNILLKDIESMKLNIKEYIEEQDANKKEYVLKKYNSLIKRAFDFGIDCRDIERDIPDVSKDAYDIILAELQMLQNKIEISMHDNIGENHINDERCLINYIRENGGIECEFGKIAIITSEKIGQGGNGLVYIGRINGIEIAIKFLIHYNSNKYLRFKAEYFNINLIKDRIKNSVNNIHYGELKINENIFPYIIMKKYSKSLREYRNKLNNIEWNNIKALFEFLIDTLNCIHKENIIHRDIKPENILIDENGEYVLADFGIAHFTKEDFPIKNKTKKSDRLANFEFSAPEQINSKVQCTPATDIYSMAQVIYWFAFGQVHKGTGIRYFEEIFEGTEAIIMSKIIHKCLQNNPMDRYQTVEDIQNEYSDLYSELNTENDDDPFKDMYEFHDILNSSNPDFYRGVSYIDNIEEIKMFFNKLNDGDFQRRIEFNTGNGNGAIKIIKYLENGNFSIDGREITVNRIWGCTSDDIYNDICILELKPSVPYIIEGKEYFEVAVINNELIVPVKKIQSGYIKINGIINKTRDLKIEERSIYDGCKYMAIGTCHQCSIISQNDEYLDELQEVENLDNELILQLRKDISKNKEFDVSMRL
jgi:serine/threonine-protein kinase